MPPEDVRLNKAAIIQRCIRRIKEEFQADPSLASPTHVDALTLNVERACQAAIDLAMHVVATDRLGIPQSSAEAFQLLEKAGKSALTEVSPISDVRSSREYREDIIKVLVKRAILQAKGGDIL